MKLYENKKYLEDIHAVTDLELPWEQMNNRTLLLSGATGLIGSFLVDVLMYRNLINGMNCQVIAIGRDEKRAGERFSRFWGDPHFTFVSHDIVSPLLLENIGKVDYILHLASNTHPIQYATDPIGTIETNILGLKHMLDFAGEHQARRFAFASSNEIYGENRGDVEFFEEDYCGYINSNTLRAGYPESKRCGEALCQAYIKQKNTDIVIPRLTRTYGPTMKMTDAKAVSQFIRKGIVGEDIVLKSAGTQYYSYQYVADSVSGLLTVLLKGVKGEAYNIADERGDITLRDLAEYIAELNGRKVILEEPDDIEKAGFSKATKARLNGNKLKKLGWQPNEDIWTGIKKTIEILKETVFVRESCQRERQQNRHVDRKEDVY